MVIVKAGRVPPDGEDDDTDNNDPYLSDVIESSGMGRPNRDLDVTTECSMIPAQVLYGDDDIGESDVMLGQGPWFWPTCARRRQNFRPISVGQIVTPGYASLVDRFLLLGHAFRV